MATAEKAPATILRETRDPVTGERVFVVASRTRPSWVYLVRCAEYGLICDCPGYGYRGHCAHRDAVHTFLGDEETE